MRILGIGPDEEIMVKARAWVRHGLSQGLGLNLDNEIMLLSVVST